MKSNKFLKITFIIIQVICLILTVTNITYADMYEIYKGSNPFNLQIGKIIGLIQAIGMAIAVIMLTYIGIKYIYASPEGKAELKQQLFPYFIGCLLLFGGSWLIGIIANVANTEIK